MATPEVITEGSDDGSATEAHDAQAQRRTAVASIVAATLLMVLKLGTGLVTGSLGLVSAGIESSGDVVAATVTLFAVRLGARPADREHPFGHRRVENLSALAEATILLAGGSVVVVEAISRLAGGRRALDAHWYVFLVIAVAIAVDCGRVTVSLRTARRYGSAALRSNAFHFAGDMMGSIAVLVGLIAVRLGFHQGDSVAALIVGLIVFATAGRLTFENARVLMDTAPLAAQAIATQAIESLTPEVELQRLRVRESAGRYFADFVVSVPAGRAVVEGHAAADQVERSVHEALPGSDVVVHVEPRQRGLGLRDQVLAIALAEPLVHEAHDITIFEHGHLVSVSLHLKFPTDISLADAHTVAERVEAAVADLPGVEEVRTHLEPLERPVPSTPSTSRPDGSEVARIRAVVREQSGHDARDLRVLPTRDGYVLFVTVPMPSAISLADAHRQASELEEQLRRREPHIADVVVHTEPLLAAEE